MKMTFKEVLETRSYKDFCVIVADRKEFNEPIKPKNINKYICRLLMNYGTINRKVIYKAIKHALRTA